MKKRKKNEEHIDEGWLLPYSDMLTLLLALFIVLFAMAKVDTKKFQEFKSEFGTLLSTHQSSNAIVNVGEKNKTQGSALNSATSSASSLDNSSSISSQAVDNQLETIKQQLATNLQNAGLTNSVSVYIKSNDLHIVINSSILFDSGSATLSESTQNLLTSLFNPLKAVNTNPIIIAGYTDNQPLKSTSTYKSNWELSSARAISVMNFFVSNKVFNEDNISIQAYGENKPKDTNTTASGRSNNRRVEIIVEKNSSSY
ncbi:OmpA family protein [Liquorilactobacillus mali]|uniref:Chemotaxis protein MotB n=2 Tax=Liquorilactobacillus mali KCTC 3596 = DSM 20444 TaxID=1046596 RepID=J0L8F9_9LACO|nr:OmpA family protein [Liquorilactobacillus mali]AJA34119.1 chemotaxis protein MotB [Liquorilactobacillus mali KCTC 3596 = DSM 20444]EJF02190.1 Flagellar motor protein MotB [Liquorilactobacillus mali KCTC 3596 = DSM 20444]MDC7953981.1 OmpA family protein [Liquorilactobacillus mali]MDV7757450.1 OmpA family protein [Liquorilactobacillus mali]QFQ75635.1 OmpA family protein [Liquorilactobacillus mali]